MLPHNRNRLPSILVGQTVYRKIHIRIWSSYWSIWNTSSLSPLLWFEGRGSVEGIETGIYVVPLLFKGMGQSSKDFALWEERLASDEIFADWREERATPINYRIKILAPSPHIKLGLVKSFVKSMDMTWLSFGYLATIFPRLNKAKTNKTFLWILGSTSSSQRNSLTKWFRAMSKSYNELVEDILFSYHKFGCNMSLKIHFLDAYFDFFRDN